MAEMTIEKAQKIVEQLIGRALINEISYGAIPSHGRKYVEIAEALTMCGNALREKRERETPLTWEQLKAEEGNPIWSEKTGWAFLRNFEDVPYKQIWYLRNQGECSTVLFDHTKFYRYKPERSAE